MNRNRKIHRLVYWLACFIIAATLLLGYHKLIYPADFSVAVYRFRLLPGFLVNLTAIYLPWLEISCAVCLLFIPRYRVAALWIVMALLILFTGAIAVNLWRGSVFGCGCFGRIASDEPLSWVHLLRNSGFILLIAAGLAARRKMGGDTSLSSGCEEAEPSRTVN